MAMSKRDSLRLFNLGKKIFAEQEGAMTAQQYDEFKQQEAEIQAEMAYERHLEDRGWMDTFEEEQFMRSQGIWY